MSIGNYSRPWKWVRIQLAVYLGLAPLLALWFGQIPLFSIIANCIAIPWVSFRKLATGTSWCVSSSLSMKSAAYVMFDMASQSLELIWIILEGLARPDNLVFLHITALSGVVMYGDYWFGLDFVALRNAWGDG